jgi:2'-5' RNA ligase
MTTQELAYTWVQKLQSNNMKATFALLANDEIHNSVRKLTWDIHQKYRTGIAVCQLPPHISLKQPFDISDLNLVEDYMTELAKSIKPFRVNLTHLELIETKIDNQVTGILWLNVQETEFLRQLHNRVNQELTLRLGSVPAAYDGPRYHFHMSIAIGGQPIATYHKILEEFSDRLVNLQYIVRNMVMFVYDDIDAINAGYMTYLLLPINQ